MQTIPFSHARAHLAETLRDVEAQTQPTIISRRGQSAAVLMSVDTFERLSGPRQDFGARLSQWRKQYGAAIAEGSATCDPWADVRDSFPGRDAPW